MKKIYIPIIASLIAMPAFADSDSFFYVTASGVQSHKKLTNVDVNIYDSGSGTWFNQPTSDMQDDNFGAAAAIGYGMGNWRGELELTIRDHMQVPNATIASNSLMYNMYYDIKTGTRFTPFVGLGAGASMIELEVHNLQISDETISFSAMGTAGLSFRLTDMISFNASYRYVYLGNVKLDHEFDAGGPNPAILSVEARDTMNEFLVGITLKF